MSNIGTLERVTTDSGVVFFRGKIRTLKVNADFRVIEHREEDIRTDNSPTHDLRMKDADDNLISVGSAWSKQTNDGGEMFSLSFTDPDLPDFMQSLAAFEDGTSGTYRIPAQRKRKEAA
ncbi:MAG: DUF736 family protein [Pseudomonadota bacterium]